jgi:hypothetical protein
MHVNRYCLQALSALAMVLFSTLFPIMQAYAENSQFSTGISVNEQLQKLYPQVNYNDITKIEKGNALSLKIMTTLGQGLNLEGDEFYAKLNRDYMQDGKLLLPKGTIVHGSIVNIAQAKRLKRNGHMNMKFDYLITPDGREIPIQGNSSTRESPWKTTAKTVGTSIGYGLGGGVLGAVTLIKVGGLGLVAATEGYALAIGAGLGAAGGIAYNLLQEGESALLQTGAEVQIKLAEGMALPSMNVPEVHTEDVKLPGLSVGVIGYEVKKDPFGQEKEILLTLDISNRTPHQFSMMDMALMDEDQRLFYPSPFGDTGLWFTAIGPNTHARGNMSFMVDDPTQQLFLVFYQRYTRELLAKIAVDERAAVQHQEQRKRKRRNG